MMDPRTSVRLSLKHEQIFWDKELWHVKSFTPVFLVWSFQTTQIHCSLTKLHRLTHLGRFSRGPSISLPWYATNWGKKIPREFAFRLSWPSTKKQDPFFTTVSQSPLKCWSVVDSNTCKMPRFSEMFHTVKKSGHAKLSQASEVERNWFNCNVICEVVITRHSFC